MCCLSTRACSVSTVSKVQSVLTVVLILVFSWHSVMAQFASLLVWVTAALPLLDHPCPQEYTLPNFHEPEKFPKDE